MHKFLMLLLLITCLIIRVSAENIPTNDPEQETKGLYLDKAIDFLADYLKIPSVTGDEGAAGQFLAEYCRQEDLHVKILSEKNDSYNLTASLYPLSTGKPNIILLSHIDVVPAGDIKKWTHPPYDGKVTEHDIIGRGALDCKGLGAMHLMSLLQFKENNSHTVLPFNITVLFVSGEETGGEKGSQWVIEHFLDYLNPMVVFGEGGSGMRNVLPGKPNELIYGVSIAEKSNLWLKMDFEEDGFGHGSTPGNTYATKTMIEALARLNTRKTRLCFNRSNRLMFRELGQAIGGMKGFFIKNCNFFLFSPFVKSFIKKDPLYRSLLTNTVTITHMNSADGPPNQIASNASATLDCRLLPGTTRLKFKKKLAKIIGNPDIRIEELDHGPPSVSTDPDVYFELMKNSLLTYHHQEKIHVVPMLLPATTDNGYFRAEGVPTYGFMPGELSLDAISKIHNTDEHISKSALNDGINIFNLFMEQVKEHFHTTTGNDLEAMDY